MWFYTGPHIPGTLNGCHGLGHSILSVTLYQRCCYDQRMWESTVFETLRVLSVLLITVFTRMPVAQSKLSPPCCWYLVPPKHAAAMQGFFKLDLSIYWHSRWTSSSDCSASAMGGTLLQWFMWTHVALSATFTAVCVTRSTWKGPSHLFDFQLFLLWSRITTKSPGLTSCRNLSATFSFYLHRNIWQQTRHFFAVIQHVIFTHIRWWQPLFTPFHAHEWWPAKQNFKWAQVCFLLFFSFSCTSVQLGGL